MKLPNPEIFKLWKFNKFLIDYFNAKNLMANWPIGQYACWQIFGRLISRLQHFRFAYHRTVVPGRILAVHCIATSMCIICMHNCIQHSNNGHTGSMGIQIAFNNCLLQFCTLFNPLSKGLNFHKKTLNFYHFLITTVPVFGKE